MKWVSVGVLLGSSFLWAGSGPNRPQTLVITNVNVVDTRHGGIHPHMAIAIKDGMIVAVMKYALVESGPQLEVINGNSAYLIPGLWDMKAHVRGLPAEAQTAMFDFDIANGVTGVRDMNTDELEAQRDDADIRPEVEPARPLWLQRTKPSEIPSGWRHSIEDLNEIFAACCVRAFTSSLTPERNPQGSDSSASIQTVSDFTSETARKTFIEISDHATWVVPGLVAEEDAVNNSERELPPQGMKPQASSSEAAPLPRKLLREIELVRNMHRLGVQFLAGTGGNLNRPGKHTIAEELELLVMSGLTPLEALQSATINPALCMANLNKYGVVEANHIADLVLLEGNPLEDVRNARKISAVVLRGQYLPRADLDAMLAAAQSEIHGEESAASSRSASEQ